MGYGRGFSYTGNDELPGLSRRYVPGSADEHGSGLNSTIRDFNEADRAAADAQFAPQTSIAARFNPLSEGSAFRRSNPVGWEALNQKYGQPDTVPGSENFDAQKYHDQAMAPSAPGMEYARSHIGDYSPQYQQTLQSQLDSFDKSQGMARAPMPSVSTPTSAFGSSVTQPQPDTSYSIDKLTGVASSSAMQPKPLVNPSTPGLGTTLRNNPFFSTINSFLGIDK